MRSEKTTTTSILVVLLVYMFMAGNTSGEGIALCIGANGHVALEKIFHEHCHNHPHSDEQSVSHSAQEHNEHLESPHCKPCIDIPIFMGSTSDQLPPKQIVLDSDAPDTLSDTPVIPENTLIPTDISQRSYRPNDHSDFLCTVILLV